MARPRKKGSYYFPLDVDILEDRKIRMLRNRFGADGVYFYIFLLCEIYREGFYLIWDKEWEEIALVELSMSREKVGQMRNYLLERSLFDKTLFQSVKALTSRAVQTRYQEIVRARGHKNPVPVDGRYWLLSPQETEEYIIVSGWETEPENTGFSENNHAKKRKENKKENQKEIVKYNDNKPPAAGKRLQYVNYGQRDDDAYRKAERAAMEKIREKGAEETRREDDQENDGGNETGG